MRKVLANFGSAYVWYVSRSTSFTRVPPRSNGLSRTAFTGNSSNTMLSPESSTANLHVIHTVQTRLRNLQLQLYYVTTHTHPFNGPFSGTTQVSRYQKGKTNLDFTEARDSEWQWHQLGYMQVCTLLRTDNHASTPPLCFLQVRCPSCCPTNSVKALKACYYVTRTQYYYATSLCKT